MNGRMYERKNDTAYPDNATWPQKIAYHRPTSLSTLTQDCGTRCFVYFLLIRFDPQAHVDAVCMTTTC